MLREKGAGGGGRVGSRSIGRDVGEGLATRKGEEFTWSIDLYRV